MFKSKLPDTGLSIFAVMTSLANQYNALNLSQGFPNFNPTDELVELVNYYMKHGNNQYAPMPGVPSLRNEISKKINLVYGGNYNSENEITITAGATQALFTAITTFINKDDEVIIFEPAYDSYIPSIKFVGGKAISVRLEEKDFSIPWNLVHEKINDKTKMIILNSPHNPTGAIIGEDDLSELIKIAKENDILILSDEVYEHIIFDNRKHFSLTEVEALKSNSIIVSSFGKTYHTTGWKLGYIASSNEITNEFRKVHQFNVFAVNTPIQLAYAEYLSKNNDYLVLPNFYQKKRDLFASELEGSNFKLRECYGTYFQLLDYSNISDEKDIDFTKRLITDFGIATIPLSPFYTKEIDSKLIRVCFAKTDDVLIEGAKRLKSVN
ncbi:MAG: aminotransferase class I/II-fold pyridoxal phosphate-dependent enzyme [Ignavibacteriaceae bacterium]|nr:aminotransferase class I/II-fold pyridoxal phosphate-dependent enzyme [Ignavibacteriaceae bacterium]